MDQSLSQHAGERTSAEAEEKLVQVGLEMGCGQAVIDAQNKRFGVAEYDMQPMEHTTVGVIVPVLVGIVPQNRDIAAITIAADDAALLHSGIGKFLHRGLLDILGHTHLEILWIAVFIQ